jgi:hypothetical protein
MTQRFLLTLTLAGLVSTSAPGASADKRLHMHVYPTVVSAPGEVLISVGIERRPENRVLRVTASSADFYRSSEVQLDGEESPRVSAFKFRELPPGEYDASAELIGANGRTIVNDKGRFIVTGLGW